MRAEGKQELEALHASTGAREDIAIVSLAALDLRIARTFDPRDKVKQTEREYHTTLAFYLRENPNMAQARAVYDKLNGALRGDSDFVDLSDEDADIDI